MSTYNLENLYDFRDDPTDGCDFAGNTGCPGVSPPFDYVPAQPGVLRRPPGRHRRADHRSTCTRPTSCSPRRPRTRTSARRGRGARLRRARGGRRQARHAPGADAGHRGRRAAAATTPPTTATAPTTGASCRPSCTGPTGCRWRRRAADDPVLGAAPAVVYRAPGLPENADVSNPKTLNAELPDDVDTSTGTDGGNVFTRAPQVAHFLVAARPGGTDTFDLWAISNHFSSGPDGRVGQRTEQAAYAAAIVEAIGAADPDARVVVGGDLNVFPRPDDPFAPGRPAVPVRPAGPAVRGRAGEPVGRPGGRRAVGGLLVRVPGAGARRSTSCSSTGRPTPTWSQMRAAHVNAGLAGRLPRRRAARASATTTRRWRGSPAGPSCR